DKMGRYRGRVGWCLARTPSGVGSTVVEKRLGPPPVRHRLCALPRRVHLFLLANSFGDPVNCVAHWYSVELAPVSESETHGAGVAVLFTRYQLDWCFLFGVCTNFFL